MHWKTLKSQIVLKNKFLEVTKNRCQKTDGKIVPEYYVIKKSDVVIIAAFTKKMELILINQYRYPIKNWDIELPAGYLEPKDKNNLKKAATRELLEETGYKAKSLEKIGEAYASAGMMNNTVNFFIGFNAEKISEQKLDESEELKVKVEPWKKVLQLLKDEKIKDLGSVGGILLAKNYIEKHKVKI